MGENRSLPVTPPSEKPGRKYVRHSKIEIEASYRDPLHYLESGTVTEMVRIKGPLAKIRVRTYTYTYAYALSLDRYVAV